MRVTAKLTVVLSLVSVVACSDYDDSPAPPATSAPANVAETSTAPSTPSATAPPAASEPAATLHTASYCETQVAALGTKLVFCSDFDDDATPLGAWKNGVFDANGFVAELADGGTAAVSGGKLTLSRPAEGTSIYRTELTGELKQKVHVAFDAKVTHPTSGAASFFFFGGAGNLEAIDRAGSPYFDVRSAWSHAFQPVAPVSSTSFMHVDASFTQNATTPGYDFAGTFDGVGTQHNNGTPEPFGFVGANDVLTVVLGMKHGKETPNAAVPPVEAAAFVYDNIVITLE